MGLFGSIGAIFGGGSKKNNGMSIMDIAMGATGNKSLNTGKPPVDNSHSHSSSKTQSNTGGALAVETSSEDPLMGIDNGLYQKEFLEKRGSVRIDQTPDVTIGSGGQVGTPVLPPDINIDEQGVNSLY